MATQTTIEYPFDTWLESDNEKLRKATEELVYVHGKYWCGSKWTAQARRDTEALMEIIADEIDTFNLKLVEKAIAVLAQSHYGL